MSNILVINAGAFETRVALLEGGVVVELYTERERDRSVVGNIYKGRVVRVLPGMQAAFVEIGLGKAAFLYVADVVLNHDDVREEFGDDPEDSVVNEMPLGEVVEPPAPPPGEVRPQREPRIRELLHEGQEVLVQIAKEPLGTKGARLTSRISMPGRHLVFMPTIDHVGISRRIVDERERKRLRDVIEYMRPPGTGFIVRTAAEGVSSRHLQGDMELLIRMWNEVVRRKDGVTAPTLLYQELDLLLRATRDLFAADVDKLLVDSPEAFDRILRFLDAYVPELRDRVELYTSEEPIFDHFGIEVEVARALQRKVWLKSGGYIVIDETEALTTIDVNTGRYVGRYNLEDTILRTNLEAVQEIVYQLRLRNIGGIIILDFIDMDREANREKLWTALQEALRADRAQSNVLKVSELGLVQMTRKRVRESLGRSLLEPCFYCEGRGRLKSKVSVSYDILRQVSREAPYLPVESLVVHAHPEVVATLLDEERAALEAVERRCGKKINLQPVPEFHVEQFEVVGHGRARGEEP
jgi:ribonuclease G